jgi:Rrf2 family protein
MNITARTEYACLAMLELASHYGSAQPTRLRTIAELHGIPARFLVQILLQLKNAGLVRSTRGSSGGFQLARDPALITLADILAAMDNLPAVSLPAVSPRTPSARVLGDTWGKLARRQRRLLESITLARLETEARQQATGMYYI